MFKYGIRLRLILTFVILNLVSGLLLGSYLLWYFYNHNLTGLTANLTTQAQIVEQLLQEDLTGPRAKGAINGKIQELGTKAAIRITVIDTNGTVLADTSSEPATMENHLERPEIIAALAGSTGTATRFSQTISQNMLYVAIPARTNHEITGVIRVASSMAHVEAGYREISSVLLLAFFLTSLLTILISIRLAKNYTAPLEKITAAAREIGDGNLSRRVRVRTGDELEILARSLNKLADNLIDKINETTSETKKLTLILQHMDNAVILMDRGGRVLTANKVARDVFKIPEKMIGQHNLQVIGNSILDKSLRDTLTDGANRVIDLTTGLTGQRRIFQVFLAPINHEDSQNAKILAVFHDITALRETHDRQVEFVANASHELATPLTAIKGFAETLRDGALADKEASGKFVNIIYQEAERMHRLIQDLLQLARLDSREYQKQIPLIPLAIQDILQAVSQEMSPNAAAKNITLTVDQPGRPIIILANPDWLKQVFVNLVDNALKYTGRGGKVSLTGQIITGQVQITVRDTGIGIPEQDLPLIFDRFYRVDRARSRQAGGTGLGLAIVKFVIDLHGGQIEVRSKVGAGSSFIITLPLAEPDLVNPAE